MGVNHQLSISGRIYSVEGPKSLPSGSKVTTLRIPVNDRERDKQTGDWKDKTTWYDVPGYGETADKWAQQYQAGDVVSVQGLPDYRAYAKKGAEGVLVVQAQILWARIEFVPYGRKPRDGDGNGNGQRQYESGGSQGEHAYAAGDKDLDDIPF